MKKSSNKSSLQVSLLCTTTILFIFSCVDVEKGEVQSVESKPYHPPPVSVLLNTRSQTDGTITPINLPLPHHALSLNDFAKMRMETDKTAKPPANIIKKNSTCKRNL